MRDLEDKLQWRSEFKRLIERKNQKKIRFIRFQLPTAWMSLLKENHPQIRVRDKFPV